MNSGVIREPIALFTGGGGELGSLGDKGLFLVCAHGLNLHQTFPLVKPP